jgi:hypothetical protein
LACRPGWCLAWTATPYILTYVLDFLGERGGI